MDEEKPYFRIGSGASEHITVTPLYRPHDQCADFWDGNWVESHVEIRVGAFTGRFRASLRANEFAHFREELARLYSDLTGTAVFSSMEQWLTMKIQGDGLGHFEAECHAMDQAGVGNRLEFRLSFDQTDIPGILKGLDRVNEAFPARGSPDA